MPRCVVARTTGWCGLCYSGLRARRTYRGHACYRTPRVRGEDSVMALQRRSGGGAGAKSGEASDPDVSKWAPTVVEFLTRETWEDGQPRRTGTVMVLCEDGVFKAWVHDRDGACSCWLSAGSLLDLVDALESVLANGDGNWRKDGVKGRK